MPVQQTGETSVAIIPLLQLYFCIATTTTPLKSIVEHHLSNIEVQEALCTLPAKHTHTFEIFEVLYIVPPKKSRKRPASSSSGADSEPSTKAVKRSQSVRSKPSKLEKDHENDPNARLILRELKTAGVILTTGAGDVGQLGLGEDVLEKSRFALVPNQTNIVAIAAGGMHNACLTKDGKVVTFGCNDEGALGRNTSEEGSETVPGFVDLPAKAIQVTAGDSHSAALLDDGRVFAWGSFRDSHGTMGLLTKDNEKFPVEITMKKKCLKIASGSDHLVLLDSARHVHTFGCGEQGQLGRLPERKTDRDSRQGMKPMLTPGEVPFKLNKHIEAENVWAGNYDTFIKDTQGQVHVFGLNNYGQLGVQGVDKIYHPKVSNEFSNKNLVQICSGQHHTIALDDKGKVFVIGRKEYGRLGLGSNVGADAVHLIPVPAMEQIKCVDVGAGNCNSFAVTEEGKLYAWGMGTEGQLGTGQDEDSDVPVLIESKQIKDLKVLRVSGGGQHTIVLGQQPVINHTASNNSTDKQ